MFYLASYSLLRLLFLFLFILACWPLRCCCLAVCECRQGLEIRMDLAAGKRWARLLKQDRPAAVTKTSPASEEDNSGNTLKPSDASAVAVPSLPQTPEPVATQASAGDSEGTTSEPPASATTVDADTRFATAARVLRELPTPEPELDNALRNKWPKEKLQALLDKLWAKRQAELQEAMASMQTTASVMQGLLKRVITAARGTMLEDHHLVGFDVVSAEGGAANEEEDVNHKSPNWLMDDMALALDDLEYHVLDVDNARDFYKVRQFLCSMLSCPMCSSVVSPVGCIQMGGVTIMAQVLQHHYHMGVRLAAARVIGNTLKYNQAMQRDAVQSGLMLKLVQMLPPFMRNGAYPSRHMAPALVYAIGSLVRGSADGQAQFISLDGPSLLLTMIAEGDDAMWERPAVKALALLGDVVTEALHATQQLSGGEAQSAEPSEGQANFHGETQALKQGSLQQQQQAEAVIASIVSDDRVCRVVFDALLASVSSTNPSGEALRREATATMLSVVQAQVQASTSSTSQCATSMVSSRSDVLTPALQQLAHLHDDDDVPDHEQTPVEMLLHTFVAHGLRV